MSSRLLTIGEVIEAYGRTRYFWRKQANTGRVPCTRIPDAGGNNRYYFQQHHIESFIGRFSTSRPSRRSSAQQRRAVIMRLSRGE